MSESKSPTQADGSPHSGSASADFDLEQLDMHVGSLEEYDVGKAIGKGKFSIVYKAAHKGVLGGVSKRQVALKKVSVFNAMDKKSRDKCLKEVRLLQNLRHPNIIEYLDSFVDNQELVIVFEWAEAGDLKRQIRKAIEKRARFDERVIWKYFAQVCSAIQYMQKKRIMHRDIKPANIFLMSNGTVKVGDLGLGRYLSEQTMEAFSKVGTPLYMSPEVLKGKGYDWKSDIWSLGCILYEMACLRSPFKEKGLNLYGLFKKINEGKFEPVSEKYSETLRRMTVKMVAVDSDSRPGIDSVCKIAKGMYKQFSEKAKAKANAQARGSATNKQADNRKDKPQNKDVKPPTSEEKVSSANPQEREKSLSPTVPVAHRGALAIDTSAMVSHAEAVVDGLSILGWEEHIHISMITLDMGRQNGTAASQSAMNRAWQFSNICGTASWLLHNLGVDWAFDEYEPPSQNATGLLVSCAAAELDRTLVANISPPRIVPGFGPSVCALLYTLVNACLKKRSFRPNLPDRQFLMDFDDDNGGSVADPDEALEFPDSEDDCSSDDAIFSEAKFPADGANESFDTRRVPVYLRPEDSSSWKMEVERVTSKLQSSKVLKGAPVNGSFGEWRNRLRQMQSCTETLCANEMLSEVRDHLCEYGIVISDQASSIEKKEARILSRFCGAKAEYEAVHKRARTQACTFESIQSELQKATSTYASLEEEIDQMQSELSTKQNKMSDTARLVNLRRALSKIKADISQMELSIGVLSTQLLSKRGIAVAEEKDGDASEGSSSRSDFADFKSKDDHYFDFA